MDEGEQIRPGKADRGGTEGIFSPLYPKPLTSPIPSPLSPAPRSLLYLDGDGGSTVENGEYGPGRVASASLEAYAWWLAGESTSRGRAVARVAVAGWCGVGGGDTGERAGEGATDSPPGEHVAGRGESTSGERGLERRRWWRI